LLNMKSILTIECNGGYMSEAETPKLDRLQRRQVLKEVTVFMVLTFVLTWGIGAVMIAEPAFLTERFGPVDTGRGFYRGLFYFAVCIPSLLGLGLTYVYGGRLALRELFGRIVKWRVGWWWLIVCLGMPLFFFATEWLYHDVLGLGVGGAKYDLLPFGWLIGFFGGAILTDPGPPGEEIGWHGFALPRLAELMPFKAASFVLGIFWGLWHVPAFFIATTSQHAMIFPLFVITAIFLAMSMGAVYRGTGGSVLFGGYIMHVFANNLGDPVNNIWLDLVRYVVLAIVLYAIAARLRTPGMTFPPVVLPHRSTPEQG
jgi:uncharacterized protein